RCFSTSEARSRPRGRHGSARCGTNSSANQDLIYPQDRVHDPATPNMWALEFCMHIGSAVHDPQAPDMRHWYTAVAEDVGVSVGVSVPSTIIVATLSTSHILSGSLRG